MTAEKEMCGGEAAVPHYIIEDWARCLLPKIQAYYESDEGKQAFEAWNEQQKQERCARIDVD